MSDEIMDVNEIDDETERKIMEDGNDRKKQFENRVYTVLFIALAVIFTAFLILIFGFHACHIDGTSMSPTLHDNAIILTEKVGADTALSQGDIVVCRYEGAKIVKRVIGKPGQWVHIDGDKIWVDGTPYEDPVPAGWGNGETYDFVLGPNEYFIMGDNREVSLDSRKFGPVKQENILYRYTKTLFKGNINDTKKK